MDIEDLAGCCREHDHLETGTLYIKDFRYKYRPVKKSFAFGLR
jgi:hypothetical protein